jgi:hypothetical protein
MRLRDLYETASAGGVSAGNMATVVNTIGKVKRYKYGAPKAEQYLNPDGTVMNALDIDTNLLGSEIIRR